MQLFQMVIKKYNIHPAEIFKLAFEYSEITVSPTFKRKFYEENCKVDERGFFWVTTVPYFVEEIFCLDLLAHRVYLPKNYKRFLNSQGKIIF